MDRPTLVHMSKEERELAVVQAITSMAESLAAIKAEIAAIRKSIGLPPGPMAAQK